MQNNETNNIVTEINNLTTNIISTFNDSVSSNITINHLQDDEAKGEEEESAIWIWILGIYFGNICLGILFNGISFIALLRTKRNGTLSIVMQLTATDMFTSWVCVVELLSLKSASWSFPFPADLCPAFSGAEILCNTATLYLIISLNYHTISLCNLKMNARIERDSCDASNECLVRETGCGSTTPSVSINKNTKDISIVVPCILVWFACLSLSIPQFTLSSTVENYKSKDVICTLIDVYFGNMLINLLVVFRVFVPIALILCSICLIVFKLQENMRNDSIPNIFTKKCHNVVYYLIFCLALNCLYAVTSMQRLILYSMHAYVRDKFELNNARIYKLPPLYNQFTESGHWITLGLCMLHYSGTFLRFLIYIFLLPKFKSILSNNILSCFKRKEL